MIINLIKVKERWKPSQGFGASPPLILTEGVRASGFPGYFCN